MSASCFSPARPTYVTLVTRIGLTCSDPDDDLRQTRGVQARHGGVQSAYLERVDLFFLSNDVAAEKKVPIFLNCIGSTTYSLLRGLVAPEKPADLSLADLTAKRKAHFEPKHIVSAERFQFHKRGQNHGESVAEYLAELRRLAARCAFGNYLEEALRDRLVCGCAASPFRSGSYLKPN